MRRFEKLISLQNVCSFGECVVENEHISAPFEKFRTKVYVSKLTNGAKMVRGRVFLAAIVSILSFLRNTKQKKPLSARGTPA